MGQIGSLAQAPTPQAQRALDDALACRGAVVTDSRLAGPGCTFVALRGENTDGHDHCASALAAGAALLVVERPVDGPHVLVRSSVEALGQIAAERLRHLRRSGDITVIGITGSAGKTTTKDLLGAICSASGPTVYPRASFNNEIGLPLTVCQAGPQTRYLVLEMGAGAPGDLEYLCRIAPPDIAVVLMVGSAHLGGFGGTVEAVASAKAEIVAGLAPGGTAVLNADDPRVVVMAEQNGANAVTFGLNDADFTARNTTVSDSGRASFDLCGPGEQARVNLGLVGEHHVYNALAAGAAASLAGISVARSAHTLEGLGPLSPHRSSVSAVPGGGVVIDDSYNCNPDSLRAGLKTLVDMGRARGCRTVAVVGDMAELGEASAREHELAGEEARRLGVDVLVTVGEAARGAHAGFGADGMAHFENVDQAKEKIAGILKPGDAVLVKASNSAGLWALAEHIAAGGKEN